MNLQICCGGNGTYPVFSKSEFHRLFSRKAGTPDFRQNWICKSYRVEMGQVRISEQRISKSGINSPSLWPTEPRLQVRSTCTGNPVKNILSALSLSRFTVCAVYTARQFSVRSDSLASSTEPWVSPTSTGTWFALGHLCLLLHILLHIFISRLTICEACMRVSSGACNLEEDKFFWIESLLLAYDSGVLVFTPCYVIHRSSFHVFSESILNNCCFPMLGRACEWLSNNEYNNNHSYLCDILTFWILQSLDIFVWLEMLEFGLLWVTWTCVPFATVRRMSQKYPKKSYRSFLLLESIEQNTNWKFQECTGSFPDYHSFQVNHIFPGAPRHGLSKK